MSDSQTTSDPDQRRRRIDRIRKLLALGHAAGATEHEAATALEMAQRQMEAWDITEGEMRAQAASEAFTETGASVRVPAWEARLAVAVGCAFACDSIHHGGRWSYVGIDPAPEIATYAFDVLRRQCLRARTDYVRTQLRRVVNRRNKTRRADLFTMGWIETAVSKARITVRRPKENAAVAAFKALSYPSLTDLAPFDRNAGRALREHEMRDRQHGRLTGIAADFHVGVNGHRRPPRLAAD